jgi:heat shock protein HslJ
LGWVSLTTPEETLTIAEPERYTLRFSEGDRVALRADCNRGAGSVVFPEPGAIRFGVLAITRAMCPTGSFGDRFAREVVRAGRWAIQRGELRLELIRGRRCPSLHPAAVRARFSRLKARLNHLTPGLERRECEFSVIRAAMHVHAVPGLMCAF